MEPFTRLEAVAAPLPIANVDTDKILPGRFLKTVSREGLGEKLFWDLRQEVDFVLNRTPWNQSGILIALDNFGCGSSREHAPWALLDFGISCIIAPSIADIFYNNCFKNGMLPITLPHRDIDMLINAASDPGSATMTVDLIDQTVMMEGLGSIAFSIDEARKSDLINGVDDISRALEHSASIDLFERRQSADRPWNSRFTI